MIIGGIVTMLVVVIVVVAAGQNFEESSRTHLGTELEQRTAIGSGRHVADWNNGTQQ